MAILEYHLSDSYQNSDGVFRADYYAIDYIPNANFDGRDSVVGASSVAWALSQYRSKYNAAMTYPSPCSLNIFVDYDSTTRKLWVKARVTKVDAFSSARLRYAIAENYIPYTWGEPPDTQQSLRHVERKMLPNYGGKVIPDTLQIGSAFVDSQSYTLSSAWTPRNCYVVVFVQKDDAGTVKPVLRSTESELFSTWVFGDANGDSAVDINDVVYLTNYLFVDGPAPRPPASGDSNRDCIVNVLDIVYLINYVFVDGPAPLKGCAW